MDKLTDVDFQWHADQPDVPGKRAAEMKAFFDAPSKTLREKVNEIIDKLYGKGEGNGELSGALADILSLLNRMGTAETNQQTLSETVESNKRNLTTMIANVDKSAKEIFDDVEILKTDKQNKLIAGENITIEGNLISADVGAADQTYDAASENAQSGKAVAEAIAGKQDKLTAGNRIVINNNTINAETVLHVDSADSLLNSPMGIYAAGTDIVLEYSVDGTSKTYTVESNTPIIVTRDLQNGAGTFVTPYVYFKTADSYSENPEQIVLFSVLSGNVDQSYNAESENAQSGKAVAEALATKQDVLTAGDNIAIENGVISASGGGGNVNDVQIAGTSIVKDGIADIPVASQMVKGVTSAGYALSVNTDGVINAYAGYDSLYTSRGAFCVVGSNFDKIVKLAMCDGKGAAWTADEQEAAKDRLGIGKTTFSGTKFGTSVAISDLSGIAPNHVNITLSLQAQIDGQTDTSLNGVLGTFVNYWTYNMTSTKKVVNMDCFATGNDVYRVSVLLYDDNGGLPEDAYESFVKQDFFISLSNLQNMAFSCSDANTGESVDLNLEYSGYYEL